MTNSGNNIWAVFRKGLRHAGSRKTDVTVSGSNHPLISGREDREAMVTVAIAPESQGRVRFRGSLWPARNIQDTVLEAGSIVYVVGVSNITLLVKPSYS